jgi:methylated-DNA-[protein]-cysteine S-methyltransferase
MPHELRHATLKTEGGPWTAVVDESDVVILAGFGDAGELLPRLHTELAAVPRREVNDLGAVTVAMRAYLAGDLAALDAVPVHQPGGPFQQEVWQRMREIPPGQTWSYGELAVKAGHPTAVRAVGTACARNLVAPIVPCHRVVRGDGSLGGYAYGLATKRWLLALEGATLLP